MSYLIGLFVDIIPRDLASLWSQIIGRSVTAPERFRLTSLTSQEMMRLRSQYSSDNCNKKVSEKNDIINQDPPRVSTCMTSILTSHYPLPHVAVVINQSGHKNLKVERAMVDTGSQISLVSSAYLAQHKHVENAITPLSQPCSLKSATGRSMNPFKGKILLAIRFVDKQGKLTRKMEVEFHVLQNSSQLEGILLGLNFLIIEQDESF